MNLQPQYNFAAIASAAVLGGFAMLFVQEKHGNYNKEADKPESAEDRLNAAK
jgi:AAHS family benzoate transporter-like MFS transporter